MQNKDQNKTRRILFVDDNPEILSSLKRLLRPMKKDWEMYFMESGVSALEVLSQRPFDVVVSDIRMPGMDGVELLTKIGRQFPEMIRIVLSGQSSHELVLKSVGPAHQFLAKPCDINLLITTIRRSLSLKDLLAEPELQRIITRLDSVPSLPALYEDILRELQSSNSSMSEIGEIISRDMGMTAKILQLVNSAFFGIPQHISHPKQAVVLLGIDIIKALVLTINIFSRFESGIIRELDMNWLWGHSSRTGVLARKIAMADKQSSQFLDTVYIAGLLHDVGMLIMASNFKEQYVSVTALIKQDNISLHEAERRVFGKTHAEIGGYLLGLWGLPDPIVEAVYFHHNPAACINAEKSALSFVHIANALDLCKKPGFETAESNLLDNDYADNMFGSEKITEWEKLRDEVISGEVKGG